MATTPISNVLAATSTFFALGLHDNPAPAITGAAPNRVWDGLKVVTFTVPTGEKNAGDHNLIIYDDESSSVDMNSDVSSSDVTPVSGTRTIMKPVTSTGTLDLSVFLGSGTDNFFTYWENNLFEEKIFLLCHQKLEAGKPGKWGQVCLQSLSHSNPAKDVQKVDMSVNIQTLKTGTLSVTTNKWTIS